VDCLQRHKRQHQLLLQQLLLLARDHLQCLRTWMQITLMTRACSRWMVMGQGWVLLSQ
jgi:hypothetical protein